VTAGLVVLLAVLATANVVTLVLRQRVVDRRAWEAEQQEYEDWLERLRLIRLDR